MISTDKTALLCDFAETYHIYDLKSLPFLTVAALASGLREDSRIKLKMAGQPRSMDTMLLATIADRLAIIVTGLAGSKKQPVYLTEVLYGTHEEKRKKKSDAQSFDTAEDFKAARAEILGANNEQRQ